MKVKSVMLNYCRMCNCYDNKTTYCSKIDKNICEGFYCVEEKNSDLLPNSNNRRKKSTKQSRAIKYKGKLNRFFKYGSSMVLQPFDWNNPDSKMIKKSYGCDFVRFHKNHCNRRIRRYNGEVKNGSYYKKMYEYRWVIY